MYNKKVSNCKNTDYYDNLFRCTLAWSARSQTIANDANDHKRPQMNANTHGMGEKKACIGTNRHDRARSNVNKRARSSTNKRAGASIMEKEVWRGEERSKERKKDKERLGARGSGTVSPPPRG